MGIENNVDPYKDMVNPPQQENHDSDKAEKDKLWEQSQKNSIIEMFNKGGKLQEIMDVKEAFESELNEMGCADGRVLAKEIGTAGNLILASEKAVKDFIEKHKDTRKIEYVESHDGCGAAAIKFKELKESGKWDVMKNCGELPDWVITSDDLGRWWSQKLAGRLGASYGHRSKEEMEEIHNERAICLDGTGRFNPDAIKEMPAHYTCTGPGVGINVEDVKKELKVLSGIAFGDHGFGHRFDENNKFYILVCAKDSDQLKELINIAQEAINQLGEDGKGEKFSNKIEVKGFIHKVDESEQ